MFPIKEKHNKSNLVQGPYAIVWVGLETATVLSMALGVAKCKKKGKEQAYD